MARRGLAAAALAVVLEPAVVQLYTLGALFASRFAYPMDLEWMESGHLYHAYRLLHHLPLYIDPARGFAAFPYPPLFWIVIAAVGRVVGLDYWTARAISIASVIGIVAIFGVLLVRRAPARWLGLSLALLAAASVGAGYPLSGASFDLARSDSFATFLVVVAAALIGDGRPSTPRLLTVAVALIASVYAKQTNVFFGLWIVGFTLARDKNRGVLLAVTSGGLSLVILAVLGATTGGWFYVWLFDMRHHAMLWSTAADPLFVFVEHGPLLLLLPLLVAWARRQNCFLPETSKWVGVLGTAILSSLLAHLKEGGWRNLFIPVLALSWPVTFLVLCDVLRASWASGRRRALWGAWAALGASGVILFVHEYDPRPYAPTPEMWLAAHRFHAVLSALDGEVVVTTIPFAAVRDGKRCAQPSLQAYLDAQNAGMPVSFVDALVTSQARWVVVTGTPPEQTLDQAMMLGFERKSALEIDLDSPGVRHPLAPTLWSSRAMDRR